MEKIVREQLPRGSDVFGAAFDFRVVLVLEVLTNPCRTHRHQKAGGFSRRETGYASGRMANKGIGEEGIGHAER